MEQVKKKCKDCVYAGEVEVTRMLYCKCLNIWVYSESVQCNSGSDSEAF